MCKISKTIALENLVQYHPYDAQLPTVFSLVKSIIQKEIPGIEVEHIGSSAIPGTGGKNMIDLVIPSEEVDQTKIRGKLHDLGFQESPYPQFGPVLNGSIVYQKNEYMLNLYVMSSISDSYQKWISFRDYMLKHPEDAKAYDQLKQKIVVGKRIGYREYQQVKTTFLNSIMQKINAENHS